MTQSGSSAIDDRPIAQPRNRSFGLWEMLTVIGLALAVVGAVLLLMPRSNAVSEPKSTSAIVEVVNNFGTRYNTYDLTDPEAFVTSVTPLMTDSFAATTEQLVTDTFELAEGSEAKSANARVKSVAIHSQSDTRAEVLIATDATITNSEIKGERLNPQRWRVLVKKIDGKWLVDGYASIAAGVADDATAPAPNVDNTPSLDPDDSDSSDSGSQRDTEGDN